MAHAEDISHRLHTEVVFAYVVLDDFHHFIDKFLIGLVHVHIIHIEERLLRERLALATAVVEQRADELAEVFHRERLLNVGFGTEL